MKKIAIPAIALAAICLVCAAVLALTNSLTKQRVESLDAEQRNKAMSELIPAATDFGEAAETETEADGKAAQLTYYIAKDGKGNVAGYIFLTSATGYGGEISVMTAMDTSKKVIGVKLVEISETPALGMKAQDESFLSQFARKVKGISATKNKPEGNQIQAITGATITSNAVVQAVNMALSAAEKLT
jgi:electron transport complex protein RnfG